MIYMDYISKLVNEELNRAVFLRKASYMALDDAQASNVKKHKLEYLRMANILRDASVAQLEFSNHVFNFIKNIKGSDND